MKKTFLSMAFLLAGIPLTAGAQTGIVIVPSDAGRPEKSFGMKDVDRIGFSDGGFAVESTDGSSVPYTFAQVGRIKFDDAAGIGSVTQSAAGELKPYYRDGMLGADGLAAGQTAKAAVYDLNGRAIMLVGRWDGSCIDVSRLAAGVYTFTVNGVTIKFTK